MTLRRAVFWLLNLVLGLGLGLVLLEALLHINPGLLLRGMALPAPADPPITTQKYTVKYSDADLFYWQADEIQPLNPEDDRIESEVIYQTDEFGFHNIPPSGTKADIVVLGRSFSLGAQSDLPWVAQLAQNSRMQVLNLSQAGADIRTKGGYFEKYGLLAQPKWLVIEVMPSMDIFDYRSESAWLIKGLPFSIAHTLIYRNQPDSSSSGSNTNIYPLKIETISRTESQTFFNTYLSGLTVNREKLVKSNQWKDYTVDLKKIIDSARNHQICVLLLYVPTKEEIYTSLAIKPEQIAPALSGIPNWGLNTDENLLQEKGSSLNVSDLVYNSQSVRQLIKELAENDRVVWVDPTPMLTEAAEQGYHPYMIYDSHWSKLGHKIVATEIERTLHETGCP